MITVRSQPRLSPQDYLALERAADVKSEYYEGSVYAMAGSTPEHSAITANTIIDLGAQLADGPCQVFSSDMKVRTSPTGLFAYPYLSVVCGEPLFHDEHRDVLINPIVVVEVLSDSTEAYDRGKKFMAYRQLESLQHYILIAQDAPYIEVYSRRQDDTWLLITASSLESSIAISSMHVSLSLARVYRHIRFQDKVFRQDEQD